MTSRDRERTRSLLGSTSHEPPPAPPPASEVDQVEPERPGIYGPTAGGYRDNCPLCKGKGWYLETPNDAANCPRCAKPTLSPALERLRLECGLSWISAEDCGDCPDGVLWVWAIWDLSGNRLPLAIEHNRHNHDRELLTALTAFRLGMKTIPY